MEDNVFFLLFSCSNVYETAYNGHQQPPSASTKQSSTSSLSSYSAPNATTSTISNNELKKTSPITKSAEIPNYTSQYTSERNYPSTSQPADTYIVGNVTSTIQPSGFNPRTSQPRTFNNHTYVEHGELSGDSSSDKPMKERCSSRDSGFPGSLERGR